MHGQSRSRLPHPTSRPIINNHTQQQDAHEKSVELRHFVKLFHGNNPNAATNAASQAPASKKVGRGLVSLL